MPFATTYALQACSTHQARNALATDPLPLGYKLLVYARDTVGAIRTLVNLHDPFRQSHIGLRSCRQRPLEPRVVPTGGDFQDPAHRGYFIEGLIGFHELVDSPWHRVGLPSEPGRGFCKDLPLLSQLPILAAQSSDLLPLLVIRPSLRRPSSRSACRIQIRIAWADGSNSRDNSWGVRPARTSSTICRLNSGGYGECDLGHRSILLSAK